MTLSIVYVKTLGVKMRRIKISRLEAGVAIMLSAISMIISAISGFIELMISLQAIKKEVIEFFITGVTIGLFCAFILAGIVLNTRLREYLVYSLRALTSFFLTIAILGLIILLANIPENLVDYLGRWKPIADTISQTALSILIVFVVFLFILYGMGLIRERHARYISQLRTAILNIAGATARIREATVKATIERHVRNIQQILAGMARGMFLGRWDAARIMWATLLLTGLLISLLIILPAYETLLSWFLVFIIILIICAFLIIIDSLRTETLRSRLFPS